ncbi:MAG: hypothetical protein AAGE52_39100, partial [Myxococcota bacterium]
MRRFFALAIGVLGATSANAQPCEIEGFLREVRLVVVDAEVPVRVRALVTARPTATARTEVDVNGSLAFRAHGEDLPFVIQRRVTTGFGMVSLTREARIERVRQTRRGLTATAYLNPWTKIRRLSFPCEAITLQGEPTETPTPLRDLADGVQMRALPNI